jgi:hypothetical protein
MLRRFLLNLQVNLAVGFLLFFFSERLFWTVFKPSDQIGDLVITWLAYSVLGCLFLNILKRFGAANFPRVALAGGIYGWLTEGALVGTLYGTESSAPFPLSLVQTALSWHMLISVLVGWYLLTGAVRRGSILHTALISAGIGLFWAAWAPFQWRETPPVIVPISSFIIHAALTGSFLALACATLSGAAWTAYKPGWFGSILSALILAFFYSQQIKALGLRPLIILPLLVGASLGLLCWTKKTISQPETVALNFQRWKCATAIMIMPLTATIGYAVQIIIKRPAVNPSYIFQSLAVIGAICFVAACAILIRKQTANSLHNSMQYISASISFAFVFAGVFFLAGLFLMPHLPPVPDHLVSAFETEFWSNNWIGYLLGVVLGTLSARSVLKKTKRKGGET